MPERQPGPTLGAMADQSIRDFAQALGTKTPTPGGGAAAGHTALFGASLGQMLIEFARGRKENANRVEEFESAADRLRTVVEHLTPMAERDAAAFSHVAGAYGLPKGTNDEKNTRIRAIQESLLGALAVPEEMVHLCRDALVALSSISDGVGRNLVGDAGTSAALLQSAARAGELLVRSNASYLHDRDKARATLLRVDAVMREIQKLRREIDLRVEDLIDG